MFASKEEELLHSWIETPLQCPMRFVEGFGKVKASLDVKERPESWDSAQKKSSAGPIRASSSKWFAKASRAAKPMLCRVFA